MAHPLRTQLDEPDILLDLPDGGGERCALPPPPPQALSHGARDTPGPVPEILTRPRRTSVWKLEPATEHDEPDSMELAVQRYLAQPPVDLTHAFQAEDDTRLSQDVEPERTSFARISVVRRVVRRSQIVESVAETFQDDRR
jgi:hypothetical protein